MDEVRAKRIAGEMRGKTVGSWTVGDYLGNGASAVVLEAQQGERAAAIKLLDSELVERFGFDNQLARINRELTLIGHEEPHLVQIFDGGHCQNTDYLFVVMEIVTDSDLTDAIADFPRECIGIIMEQIAGAARYLESRGIVHRDIKPDNISISSDRKNSKLLDLGIILPFLDENASKIDAGTGDTFLGTTRYSPPEFIMRTEEDTTDGWRAVTFYQIGAVLHDMIMRRKMFDEISAPPAKLIDAVRNIKPIIEAVDVPDHLVRLARVCLNKEARTRLVLLRWEDFTKAGAVTPEIGAKERVRERIAAAKGNGASITTAPILGASRRRTEESIGVYIRDLVREICNEAETFPPLKISHSAGMGGVIVDVLSEASNDYLLESELRIYICVKIVDEQEKLIDVSGTYGAADLNPQETQVKWASVFSGEMGSSVLREKLDNFLHLAMLESQSA